MKRYVRRRTFLRAGGVVLALPLLEAMSPGSQAAQSRKPVKRFVCLTNNYGVYPQTFFPDPKQAGAKYDLPETLSPLAKHQAPVDLSAGRCVGRRLSQGTGQSPAWWRHAHHAGRHDRHRQRG